MLEGYNKSGNIRTDKNSRRIRFVIVPVIRRNVQSSVNTIAISLLYIDNSVTFQQSAVPADSMAVPYFLRPTIMTAHELEIASSCDDVNVIFT